MSVSNVDRRRQNQSDELARLREEYQEKDASQTKRHRSEVTELMKTHQREMEETSKAHSQTMAEQSDRTRDALDSKDFKYQKDMDSMKKLHVQRMKENQEKQGVETSELRRSYSSEKETADRSHAVQVENLRRNMELQVREREDRLAQSSIAARETQSEALKGQSTKLQDHHQQEKDILITNRNKDVSDLQRDLTTTKETLGGALKQTKEEHYRTLMKRDKANMATIEDERRQFDSSQEIQRSAFKEELQHAGDQDHAGRSRIEADSLAHRKNLEEQVRGRQDTEVANLERRLQKNKVDSTVRELQRNRIGQIERKNVVVASEDRIQKMSDRSRAAELDQQEQHRRDLDTVNRKHQSSSTSQLENNKREIDRIRTFEVGGYRSELEKADERDLQKRFENSAREKKVNTIHSKEISTNQNFYKDQLEEMKRNHGVEMMDQRQVAHVERQEVTARLEKIIRENDLKHNEKLSDLSTKFETTVNEARENNRKDLKRQQEVYEGRMKDMDKRFKTELETQRFQHATQKVQIEERYQKEIEQLKKRSELEKIELSKPKV